MLNKKLYISVLVAGMLFSGCADTTETTDTPTTNSSSENSNSSSSSSNDTVSQSDGRVDITDVILSNRSGNCADYVNYYSSFVLDIQENKNFEGSLDIEVADATCVFTSNSIPNHDFDDDVAHFAEPVAENTAEFIITSSPIFASSVTTLSLGINAMMLNGVQLDILSAGCFGVGDGKIGCGDINEPFRYDPMSPLNSFGTDSHNAHTQPGGVYHYHASPLALFDTDGNAASPVIGFAADGYPIFGNYFNDNGSIRKATSSYQFKSGEREKVTYNGKEYNPGGSYDGAYISDYEYVEGLGDLDECNGMTIDGVYGYYVTDTYPWVLNCYKGTPNSSASQKPDAGGTSGTIGASQDRPPR